MSARAGGTALWRVRPIVDMHIREDLATPFAGTDGEMAEHISRLHRDTGVQYAASEVRHE